MKKAIIITAILALVAGVGGGVWLKTQLDSQTATKATQEQAQSKPEPEPSKYDVGPPDPQEILELVNEERNRIGVPPLQYDPYVAKSAQLKADDMAAKGYRQHNIPGLGDMYTPETRKLLYQDAKCARSGENVAWNEARRESSSRFMFNAWMNSEPHRKALQSADYQRTGIGTVDSLAVQHFCRNI